MKGEPGSPGLALHPAALCPPFLRCSAPTAPCARHSAARSGFSCAEPASLLAEEHGGWRSSGGGVRGKHGARTQSGSASNSHWTPGRDHGLQETLTVSTGHPVHTVRDRNVPCCLPAPGVRSLLGHPL